MQIQRLIAIPLMLFIAVAFIFAGHFILLESDNIIKSGGIRVTGTISKVSYHYSFRTVSKSADITFKTLDGKNVTTSLSDGVPFFIYVGSERTIYYNPNYPEEITVGKNFNLAYFLFVMSGFCILEAGQLCFSYWKHRKKHKISKKTSS